MTGLLMFASNWIKRLNPYAGVSMDLTKLKIAMGYLQTIKTLRALFISLVGAGVLLVLLFCGIVLFHLGVIFYAPWSMEIKMGITFGCAAIYILAAAGVFTYFFSEDKWLKIFNADKIIKELSGDDENNENLSAEKRTEFAKRS